MIRVKREQVVPYSKERMYLLVNDVESYPEFLPWCDSVRIVESGMDRILAECHMSLAGYDLCFTTRNSMVPNSSITMSLERGCFDKLQGRWDFSGSGEGSCNVSLEMECTLKGAILRRLLEPLLLRQMQMLVEVFEARAHKLYGGA